MKGEWVAKSHATLRWGSQTCMAHLQGDHKIMGEFCPIENDHSHITPALNIMLYKLVHLVLINLVVTFGCHTLLSIVFIRGKG